MDQLAAMMCAHPLANYEPGSLDRAKHSVLMYAQNTEDKEQTVALFEAMKRQGCEK